MIDLQKYYYEQCVQLANYKCVRQSKYILALEKFVFKGKVAVFSLMEFPTEVGTLSGQPIEGKCIRQIRGSRIYTDFRLGT